MATRKRRRQRRLFPGNRRTSISRRQARAPAPANASPKTSAGCPPGLDCQPSAGRFVDPGFTLRVPSTDDHLLLRERGLIFAPGKSPLIVLELQADGSWKWTGAVPGT